MGKLTRLTTLYLDNTDVSDLSPIKSLPNLQILHADSTPIFDISPVSSLPKLERLHLNGSQVRDLSPVRHLHRMEAASVKNEVFGLHFQNTPAVRNDPILSKISQLENPQRTIEAFQYLNGEHPIYEGPIEFRTRDAKQPNSANSPDKKNVLISYSHHDAGMRDQLDVHLSPLVESGFVNIWYDRLMLIDDDFDSQIVMNASGFDILIPLISPDFLASDGGSRLASEAFLGPARERGLTVIPVILRPCGWRETALGNIVVVPTGGKPITRWINEDEAFDSVASTIRALINSEPPAPNTSEPKEETTPQYDWIDPLLSQPPATVVARNGTLDFDPTEPSDRPENPDDSQLHGLPKRQKNLAEQLAGSLRQQQPASKRALSHYADEIKPSGVLLEILKDAFITIKAGFEQAIREGALNDDTIAAWETFQKNNTLFFAHYPFDLDRERLYRDAPVDIEKVDFGAMTAALSDLTKTLNDEQVAPSVGERVLDWAEITEALSYQLRDEAFRRGGAIDQTDSPDIGYEYDLPLERHLLGFAAVVKRTVSQAWVMAKKLGEFLESKDGKSIKNVVWVGERIAAVVGALALLLFTFFS